MCASRYWCGEDSVCREKSSNRSYRRTSRHLECSRSIIFLYIPSLWHFRRLILLLRQFSRDFANEVSHHTYRRPGRPFTILQWRQNGRDGVSNHQPQPFIQVQIKETIKAPRHCPLWGNSPFFPAQMASNAKNVSIWWRHHEHGLTSIPFNFINIKIRYEITYPFPNFHGAFWVSNGIPYFIMDAIIIRVGIKVNQWCNIFEL